MRVVERNLKGKKVFVAMSGGVDSSVAAALVREAGAETIGVTMCFNISYPQGRKPSCCGAESIRDAQRAAQILGIPHYVLNFAADIKDFIIEDFIKEYLDGRTPNPCVRCNQYVKFGRLFEKVRAMGADYLATGHYARVLRDASAQGFMIKKARDGEKDQSYFLYAISREILPRVLFPLGEWTKKEVRSWAEKHELNTALKPESQDICFVPAGGYQEFMRAYVGEEMLVPGPFKDHEGKVVGRHKGISHYTIGQRDKLGLALGYPAYVYRIDKAENTVFVGPEEHLFSRGCTAEEVNFVSMDKPEKPFEAGVRIRYNAAEVRGTVACANQGRVQVTFEQPQKAVTPGQSIVFYKGDVLCGGAIIAEAWNESRG